jgi:hypothetical protein
MCSHFPIKMDVRRHALIWRLPKIFLGSIPRNRIKFTGGKLVRSSRFLPLGIGVQTPSSSFRSLTIRRGIVVVVALLLLIALVGCQTAKQKSTRVAEQIAAGGQPLAPPEGQPFQEQLLGLFGEYLSPMYGGAGECFETGLKSNRSTKLAS